MDAKTNRNLILAIVLSLAVLFVWQFFLPPPAPPKPTQTTEQSQTAASGATTPATGTATTTPAAGTVQATGGGPAVETVALTRDAALAQSPRVKITTPSLTGSISLKGGRIDDLRLAAYRETTDPNSATVVLLSPSGAPDAYFVDYGWSGGADAGPLPGSDTVWTAPAGALLTTTSPVTLTWDNGAGLVFTRTIAVDDKYMFTVTNAVKNTGTAPVSLTPGGKVTRVGIPAGNGTWILHVGPIGVTDKLEMIGYADLKKDPKKVWTGINNGWLGFTDKYWAATLIPDKSVPFTGTFAYTNSGADVFETDYAQPAVTVAPGATATSASHLFAGAKQVSVVDAYTAQYGIQLFDHLIDWGWLWFFTKPLFYVIDWFFHVFGNFGLAILAVTVILKAAFYPLAARSYRSMAAMRRVQPLLADIKERYKDDKAKQQQATMELYKKEKINPLAGCWPVLVQIPVFFSLYSVLYVTLEMRQAPFFGWIQDLAAPDPTNLFNLFGLLPFTPAAVPILGGFLALGVWPIVMGITMFIQMRLNPAPSQDPTQLMIFSYMPILFTFMLAGFPAGLVIYWAFNNTLSIIQQSVIMWRHGVKVDIIGNIKNSVWWPPRTPAPAPAVAQALTLPKAANDAGSPPAAKSQKKAKKPARPAGAGG